MVRGYGRCSNCGKPLHFGNERCKWCGTLQLKWDVRHDSTEQRPEDHVAVNGSPGKKRNLLVPILISVSVLIATIVIVLVFVFNVDWSYLAILGILVFLLFLQLLTMGPTLGRTNQEGEALVKHVEGRRR